MSEHTQYEIMVKCLQGSATDEEKAALQSLFNAQPELKAEYDDLKAAWNASDLYGQNVNADLDAAWVKVKSRIQNKRETKITPMYVKWSWAIAASVLFLLGVGFLFQLSNTEIKWNTVATKAETKKIQLPDGSVVWLDQNSSLSFPGQFRDTRDIKLNGEAFFEVVKDPKHPFVISSAGTVTKVLGTSFNIRAYASEQNVEVSVVTGRVSFADSASEQRLILLPGDMGRYKIAQRNMNKTKVAPNSMAWKTGTLIFDRALLPDVMTDLERYYNISLNIKEQSPAKISFTGKFEKQPLNSALDILRSSLGLRIIRDSAQSYSVYIH